MNKGFQSLPEHVQKKIDPDMARKYEDGGEAESRKQQVINKAIELFGDASEFSIMKVLKMLSGPMPMSFAAEVVNRAQPQAAENLRNSGSELMGKVGQAAQTVGGYTLAPYIAKGMGFDRAANALGLPYDDEGNMIPGRMPKYPPENKADGGAVMQRPLFRNMGGPAAPMPQDMAPPPMAPPPMPAGPEQELMAVEQSMEGVGRNYVENMAGGIDAAEDVTSMINALRGNEAPLEARYAELAGYVGEADASQTPESVLAMVQPTILMTEEGAVDSGIGQLMQGIAGSDMETPTGDPTAMGQGVGELMAMGAGSTPPQNFRQGGEVQYFAPGGSVISNAQKMAPEYQKYFESAMDSDARAADLEEQKRLSQAQVFFDIAQTALAAGAPTATPMSAAERIAGAVGQTQLFDKMGQRSAGLMAAKQAQRAEDRQMRMAGLQGALGQSQADEAAKQALELAKAKRTPTTTNYQPLYTLSADGRPVQIGEFDLNDKSENGEAQEYRRLTSVEGQAAFGAQVFNAKSIQPFLDAQAVAAKEQVTGPEVTHVTAQGNFTYTYPSGTEKEIVVGESFYIPNKDLTKYAVQPFDVNTELQSIYSIDGKSYKALPKGSSTLLALLSGENPKWTTNPAKFNALIDVDTQKEIIKYTEVFDKEAQTRLFANQIKLQEMSDKNSEEGRKLQKEIAADANALRLTIQSNDQVFTEGRDQSLQGYKIDLRNLGSDLDQQLQAIKGQQGTEIEKLRSDLRKQNDTVKAELSLANQLQVAGVKNVYEIEKLSTQNERDKELLKLRNTLDDVSRKDQNVFTASESLLTRVAQKENNLLRINASSALQNEAQNFKLAENEKDRVLKASESALARVADLNLQIGSQAHNQAMQQARLDVTQSEGLNNREASALESALNRTLRETLQFNSQEFKAVQSEIEREFNLTESEKKALATLNQNIISNAMEEDRLNLQKARDVVNATSTEAKTALDRERLELQKIVELTITDKDVFKKYGITSLEEFEKLPEADRKIMLGYPPRYQLSKVSTDVGTKLVRINLDDPTDVVDLATYDPIAEGKFYNFTYQKNGKTVTTLQDLSTPVGKKLMQLVNSQNAKKLGSAGMLKVGTENLTPQSYITDKANGSQVITSYDNRTFVDPSDGEVKLLTEANAVGLRDSNVYEIMKKSQLGEFAEKQLKEILGVSNLDEVDVYVDENGDPLPEEEQTSLRQMIDKELKYLSGVKTTLEDVKKGTGLVSNFYALLNNVGGPFFPETFDRIFGEFAEARSSIARFNILAISAMSVNPGLRVSNMEMDKVKGILPDPARIFTNVESEAKRFKKTINLLRQQRLILLQAIEAKDPLAIGKDTSKATFGKLREINKILSLVRAGNGDAGMSLDNALQATDEID